MNVSYVVDQLLRMDVDESHLLVNLLSSHTQCVSSWHEVIRPCLLSVYFSQMEVG